MPTVNERILKAQVKHSIFLERYKEGTLRQIVGLLNKSEDDLIELISGRLAKIEERGYELGPESTKRLKKLLADVQAKRKKTYDVLQTKLSDEMNDFAEYEADFQVKLADNAGVTTGLSLPSNAQLKAIVSAQPFEGRLLKEWAQGLAQNDVKRVTDAIRIGMVQNQTIDEIVRRIRGTKSKNYADGILEISRRDAASLARTAVAHVQARAKVEVFNANADIIHKVQYVATLDSRTTIICASRDGKVFELGNQPVIPAHWGCRSLYVAYFDDEEKGNRASKFGPVPADTTYEKFLKAQDNAFQEEVLGVERAKLFRSGTPLTKFVDKSGEVYTLKELKARER